MTSRSVLGQLIRYAAVGIGSNGVLYIAYLILTRIGIGPKLAMSLLYALGVIQTFVFNKRWSFRHGGAHGPAFVRYCTAYGLVYLANLGLLMLLVDRAGWPHQWVMGGLVVVMAIVFFMVQKFWIFRGAPIAAAQKVDHD